MSNKASMSTPHISQPKGGDTVRGLSEAFLPYLPSRTNVSDEQRRGASRFRLIRLGQ